MEKCLFKGVGYLLSLKNMDWVICKLCLVCVDYSTHASYWSEQLAVISQVATTCKQTVGWETDPHSFAMYSHIMSGSIQSCDPHLLCQALEPRLCGLTLLSLLNPAESSVPCTECYWPLPISSTSWPSLFSLHTVCCLQLCFSFWWIFSETFYCLPVKCSIIFFLPTVSYWQGKVLMLA